MSTVVGYTIADSRVPGKTVVCCMECAKTHGQLNEVEFLSRLYRENILPYSQTCHYCDTLMVDGLKKTQYPHLPLDLFDSPIDPDLLKMLNQQCDDVFTETCDRCGKLDSEYEIQWRPDLGSGLGPMLCNSCYNRACQKQESQKPVGPLTAMHRDLTSAHQENDRLKLLKEQLEGEVDRLRELLAATHDQMDRMTEEQIERDQEVQLLRQALDRYAKQPKEIIPPAPGLWDQVKAYSRNQYLAVAISGLLNAAFGLAVGCLVVAVIAITANGINDMILFNKDPQAAIERLQQRNEFINLKRVNRQLEEKSF